MMDFGHNRAIVLLADYISSKPSMLMPVKELISICRRHGVMILVDGAQTIGQIQLDLETLGADFFVGTHYIIACYRPLIQKSEWLVEF